MAEAKRSQIKKKVAAAKSRNQSRSESSSLTVRAGEAKDKFTGFAREHPIATVVGGLAVGVLVSGLFRGSPTRKAGRKLGKKAMGLAAVGAELALAYAQQAMEAAGEARDAGAEKLGSWSEEAADYVTTAREAARTTGKSLTQALRDRLN